jgi:hypothetical protein
MILIGYRMLFGELCTLLNVRVDPDADYVEDDLARETLVANILRSIKHADLSVLVLSDDVYYLGLSVDTCKQAFPAIMTSRKMVEQIAECSIKFRQELKKVGLFKHLDSKTMKFTDAVVIQCEHIYAITA